ncbi:MAG: Cys-Gln thioester bond-forming surface protein [Bacilli bacterium]|nr:Cys-Gln thioester bond-forming surface protein [Bacilli bacterium]
MNKKEIKTGIIYYQKARFFREKNTNKFAYCIEPFSFFNENGEYTPTIKVDNLSLEQMKKIEKIAYFGYGYKNHTDIKWYAITQLLIWKTSDPTGGYFYFTDSLNGNKIDIYLQDMQEIENLVNKYEITPTINNLDYTFVEGENIQITNKDLTDFYETDEKDITINNNIISISKKEEGSYSYNFYSNKDIYPDPIIFYQSPNSQNLVKIGNIEKKTVSLKVNIINTSIKIIKVDKDTNSIIPSGEALLNGARIKIYNEKKEELGEYEVKNNEIIIKNLSFGKYYIKESYSNEGYHINNNFYEINLSKEKPNQEYKLDNKVIEKNIIIKKLYGDHQFLKSEENVSFEIRNRKNELINTITTNDSGIAKITLPYGMYTFTQVNSKDGYKKIDPFTVDIRNTEEEIIELKDYKIPVPDTHYEKTIWEKILEIILFLI